ncbi:MAG: lipopolysaccharide heptosyltransferase I [Acidobacteria bacterium]|nr:lipopolysaccharide heptosyltransferase I [Acidobacteriota bacterium]
MKSYGDTGANRVRQEARPLRILVVRLSAMGDVLHALPAVARLKQALPRLEVTWAVHERWSALLQDNPCVDRVIALPLGRWRAAPFGRATWREIRDCRALLREHRFDATIDFQGLVKSAVVTFFSRADRVFGFPGKEIREPIAASFYSNRVSSSKPHVIEKNLDLAHAVIESLQAGWDARGVAARDSVQVPLPAGTPEAHLPPEDFVLTSPFAGWKAKEWPPEYFAELAATLYRETGLPLVIDCAPGQEQEARWIVGQAPPDACRLHASSLEGLIAATRRARAVIGVDSGPGHLAAALGRPGVAIYGPTDPARNGPYASTFKVLRDDAAVTSYKHEDRVTAAMRAIRPADVWNVLGPILKPKNAPDTGHADARRPLRAAGIP